MPSNLPFHMENHQLFLEIHGNFLGDVAPRPKQPPCLVSLPRIPCPGRSLLWLLLPLHLIVAVPLPLLHRHCRDHEPEAGDELFAKALHFSRSFPFTKTIQLLGYPMAMETPI